MPVFEAKVGAGYGLIGLGDFYFNHLFFKAFR